MSLIHPRNPRRCRGFKTEFEELAGHRETGLQEGKTSGQNVEGSEEIRMVVGGGWWAWGQKDSLNEAGRAKLCGKEGEE